MDPQEAGLGIGGIDVAKIGTGGGLLSMR
jgi:hypothetical protein